MSTMHDRLTELRTSHDFIGAPCIGRWRWTDPPGEHKAAASVQFRHEAAALVCGTCPLPTFAHCAATARGLPKAHRRGVWAGRSYDLPTTKGKR